MKKTLLALAALSALALVSAVVLKKNQPLATEASTPVRKAISPAIQLDESKVRPYEPPAESFQSIEGSLSHLSETELRSEAKVIDATLATQVTTANSRRLSEAEQATLLAGIRKQSAIYKLLAEKQIERMRKRL